MRRSLVLLSLVFIGCGTKRLYEGPARAPNEVARLATSHTNDNVVVEVVSCDGVEGILTLSSSSESVEMLPGQHSCTVRCAWLNEATERFEVSFMAARGRLYRPVGSMPFRLGVTGVIAQLRWRTLDPSLEDEKTWPPVRGGTQDWL